METSLKFDHISDDNYPSQLYRPESCVTPLNSLSEIDDSKLEQYDQLGFISVANVLSPNEVQEVLDALVDIIEQDNFGGADVQFESAAKDQVNLADRHQYLDYIRKYMWFSHLHASTQRLMYHPNLISVVEKLLGGEVEMFQDMALLKPPGIGREKPWHQDHAYFDLPAGTKVVGVWIALDEATPENGCMHFLPGGHHEGAIPHFNRRDWQICDASILEAKGQVATPLPAGGALIFDGLTPHGTPSNRTNTRRRAIQWHYVRRGTPRTTTEDRMAIFGSEGRDVSC